MTTADGKYLLGRRTDTREWALPGGRIEQNEGALEAGLRELREESGIIGNSGAIAGSRNIRVDDREWMTVGVIVHLEEYSDDVAVREPEPGKIGNWRWADATDRPQPMYNPTRIVLELVHWGLLESHNSVSIEVP